MQRKTGGTRQVQFRQEKVIKKLFRGTETGRKV